MILITNKGNDWLFKEPKMLPEWQYLGVRAKGKVLKQEKRFSSFYYKF